MMMTVMIDDDDDGSYDDDGLMMMMAMMMMVCDHEYEYDNDNDIQVSCVFIPRRPLMRYLFRISSCTHLSIVNTTSQEVSPSFLKVS
jgi:hypothetical protein